MCGLAGWVSPDSKVGGEALEAMSNVLAHRGPDGSGLWISNDRTVGLAHRRLAIIDLSTVANQPMTHRRTGVQIIFQGDIYNHRKLRQGLEAESIRFFTDHSDTEVLLQGYSHWGLDELLRQINRMFAVSIYDEHDKNLFLVRDRLGIKSLYPYSKEPVIGVCL